MDRIDPRDVFSSILEAHTRENIYTAMPGIVVNVSNYNNWQFVDVIPLINRLYSDGDSVPNDENVIYNCPVVSPAGGGGLLSFPLKVGDNVWLDFSMRNLENWQFGDGTRIQNPPDSRSFHMSDAVAFPCIYTSQTNLHPSADNVEIKFGEHLISLTPNGELLITNGSAKITLKSNSTIDANGATITEDGNVITANGTDLDAFYQDYLTHIHSGVTSGGSNTGLKV